MSDCDAQIDRHWRDQVLDRRYRLERRIGAGGMGVVWRAVFLPTNNRYALKLVWLERPASAAGPEVFPVEAHVTIDHPHVVLVDDCFRPDGGPWIALRMPLLTGRNLREEMASRRDRRPPFTTGEAATIARQIASGVATAHRRGIIHRDLKPENVFLHREKEGDEPIAMVLDFGIAKFVTLPPSGSDHATRTGTFKGTRDYAAPEQLRATGLIGFPADVWAVGVILFECLFGKRPFEAMSDIELYEMCSEPPAALRGSLLEAGGLQDLLARMLSKDPDMRPSMSEVFDELADYASRPVADIGSPPEHPPSLDDDGREGLGPTTAAGEIRTPLESPETALPPGEVATLPAGRTNTPSAETETPPVARADMPSAAAQASPAVEVARSSRRRMTLVLGALGGAGAIIAVLAGRGDPVMTAVEPGAVEQATSTPAIEGAQVATAVSANAPVREPSPAAPPPFDATASIVTSAGPKPVARPPSATTSAKTGTFALAASSAAASPSAASTESVASAATGAPQPSGAAAAASATGAITVAPRTGPREDPGPLPILRSQPVLKPRPPTN